MAMLNNQRVIQNSTQMLVNPDHKPDLSEMVTACGD